MRTIAKKIGLGLIFVSAVLFFLYVIVLMPNRAIIQDEILKDFSIPENSYGVSYWNTKIDGEFLAFMIDAPLKDDSLFVQFDQVMKKQGWEKCSCQNMNNGWDDFIDETRDKPFLMLNFNQCYKRDVYFAQISFMQPSFDKNVVRQTFLIRVQSLGREQCVESFSNVQ